MSSCQAHHSLPWYCSREETPHTRRHDPLIHAFTPPQPGYGAICDPSELFGCAPYGPAVVLGSPVVVRHAQMLYIREPHSPERCLDIRHVRLSVPFEEQRTASHFSEEIEEVRLVLHMFDYREAVHDVVRAGKRFGLELIDIASAEFNVVESIISCDFRGHPYLLLIVLDSEACSWFEALHLEDDSPDIAPEIEDATATYKLSGHTKPFDSAPAIALGFNRRNTEHRQAEGVVNGSGSGAMPPVQCLKRYGCGPQILFQSASKHL